MNMSASMLCKDRKQSFIILEAYEAELDAVV